MKYKKAFPNGPHLEKPFQLVHVGELTIEKLGYFVFVNHHFLERVFSSSGIFDWLNDFNPVFSA